jgi:hypothetical protein
MSERQLEYIDRDINRTNEILYEILRALTDIRVLLRPIPPIVPAPLSVSDEGAAWAAEAAR